MEKREKNTIFSIHQNGEEIKEEDKILQHATDYYKELIKGFDIEEVKYVVCWTTEEQISPCEHEELIKGFDIEEVKYAYSLWKRTQHLALTTYQWNFSKYAGK